MALTDALGNLVRFVLLPGHRYDTIGFAPLIEGIAFEALIADTAFDMARLYRADAYGFEGPAIFFYPSTTSLRQDRRFMPLAARLGLIDYWRASGQWPDFCAEPGLPYDCKAEAAKAAGRGHG